jgi:hypothetical protein
MKFRQARRLLSRAGWQQVRKGATAHAVWVRGSERLVLSEHDPLSTSAISKIRRATT